MAAECSRHHDLEKNLQGESAVPCYVPLQTLQYITNNFSKEQVLGWGGFGVVYKGVLQNGQVIAVKKVVFRQGEHENQFENEVSHLMRLKHKNIVRLVGYCYDVKKILLEVKGKFRFVDEEEMLICLEFVPEGSLKKHISDECCGLDWQTRCKIIVGICHGLYYLHDNHIIHLDLKPENILLDYDMVPKITDFGLSRLREQSRIYTGTLVGTMGYIAPERVNRGEISLRSDIFSVGVVIFEIITGHRNYPDGTVTSTQDFVKHVLQNWRNRLVEQRCTSLEKDIQQIQVCIDIGLRCVNTDPANRPTAREIIECLDRWESTSLHVSNQELTRTDQPMVAREMRCRPRPRHVNDDHRLEWVDNRRHGPQRAPRVCILTVAIFFFTNK
ncbi:hypothetical protein ACP70R_044827 [Stipagrostis hirtigluma subsp. patula]